VNSSDGEVLLQGDALLAACNFVVDGVDALNLARLLLEVGAYLSANLIQLLDEDGELCLVEAAISIGVCCCESLGLPRLELGLLGFVLGNLDQNSLDSILNFLCGALLVVLVVVLGLLGHHGVLLRGHVEFNCCLCHCVFLLF